jgi:ankyrin repeat protein
MGITPAKQQSLHKSILERDVEKARGILEANPQLLDQESFPGATMNALISAVWRGDFEMTKMLVALDADVNLMINGGHKAVYWCAIRGRSEILKHLCDHTNVIYEVADMKGFTALDHAVVNGHYEVARYLHCDKNVKLKSFEFYELEKDRFYGAEVDFANFLDHLKNGQESCEFIFMKVEKKARKLFFF